MNNIRVLVLVTDAWRLDNSGGNTLDNFFHGVKGLEFAQIYCDDQMPQNNSCSKYFQITQGEVLRNFFLHKPVGHELKWPIVRKTEEQAEKKISRLKSLWQWIIKLRPQSLILGRMIAWRYSNWKTQDLEAFVKDFNPDVIYAPCYASPFQLALTRHIKKMTGKKIVTWSADDSYSLRQFSLSPFFWIIRFWNRYCLSITYPYFDDFFTISEDEIEEMSPIVGRQMKILRKGVYVPDSFELKTVHQPIKFIYAGGLYLNRHKSLVAIANALKKLNKYEVKAELHIYTGTKNVGKDESLLNDGRTSFVHGLVTPEVLKGLYQDSDVAIHCESFDLKYRLMTRLSFSTKVIDCFQSGCAILCIAWEEHTALKYLKKEDAAFCVTSVKDIEPMVRRIVGNPGLIPEYARKSYECEKRNHRIEDVQKTLYDSLVRNAQ